MNRLKSRKAILIVAGGLFVACILCVAVANLGDGEKTPTLAATGQPVVAITQVSSTPAPTSGPTATLAPSETPAPTATPAPTDTPEPTATPKPTSAPIILQGSGQTATDPIELPGSLSIARFTHQGSRNFAVYAYVDGAKDLLINEIGPYSGARPIAGRELTLDIDADGAWTVTITAIGWASDVAFAGRGDDVSGLFNPPKDGPWEITHDGERNFVVYLHCASGSDLLQNEIGPVSGSRMIEFGGGPCCWEIQADGNWSLKPR